MIFNSSVTTYTYNISIINDDYFEFTESFLASLRFTNAAPEGVVLAPENANITIIDDDGKRVKLSNRLMHYFLSAYF